MELKSNPEVSNVIAAYPEQAQKKLKELRGLILSAAEELELDALEETLKWGETSSLAKRGSTIRMDWKAKKPDQVAVYFKCTSLLVPTFKDAFGDRFNYETTRALVFGLDESLPEQELKACIKAALQYHRVKNQPNLGIVI